MISAIYNKQSIRKFIDKPISQEDIINNGMKASSSKNRPPWNYTVVNSWEKGLRFHQSSVYLVGHSWGEHSGTALCPGRLLNTRVLNVEEQIIII